MLTENVCVALIIIAIIIIVRPCLGGPPKGFQPLLDNNAVTPRAKRTGSRDNYVDGYYEYKTNEGYVFLNSVNEDIYCPISWEELFRQGDISRLKKNTDRCCVYCIYESMKILKVGDRFVTQKSLENMKLYDLVLFNQPICRIYWTSQSKRGGVKWWIPSVDTCYAAYWGLRCMFLKPNFTLDLAKPVDPFDMKNIIKEYGKCGVDSKFLCFKNVEELKAKMSSISKPSDCSAELYLKSIGLVVNDAGDIDIEKIRDTNTKTKFKTGEERCGKLWYGGSCSTVLENLECYLNGGQEFEKVSITDVVKIYGNYPFGVDHEPKYKAPDNKDVLCVDNLYRLYRRNQDVVKLDNDVKCTMECVFRKFGLINESGIPDLSEQYQSLSLTKFQQNLKKCEELVYAGDCYDIYAKLKCLLEKVFELDLTQLEKFDFYSSKKFFGSFPNDIKASFGDYIGPYQMPVYCVKDMKGLKAFKKDNKDDFDMMMCSTECMFRDAGILFVNGNLDKNNFKTKLLKLKVPDKCKNFIYAGSCREVYESLKCIFRKKSLAELLK